MLMGHSLYEFDAAHTFVNTNEDSRRTRFLLPRKELAESATTVAFKPNWLDHYYPSRPKELEHASLFNMMTYFEVTKTTTATAAAPAASDVDSNTSDNNPCDSDDGDLATTSAMERMAGAGNPFRHHYHVANKHSPFYEHPSLRRKRLSK